MTSPSTAEASALSRVVLVDSASDLSVWQAVIISCIWRKLATARTSSTFSGLRFSLAVYMNSSTCPRPVKDRTLSQTHLRAYQCEIKFCKGFTTCLLDWRQLLKRYTRRLDIPPF